ncbi:MAG: hypothetical protein ABIG30_02395 [Candidatus Aenigmatarchaeota archaeon]
MYWNKTGLLDIRTLSKDELDFLLECSQILEPYSGIYGLPKENLAMCNGKVMIAVFFGSGSQSTRTKHSFCTAMQRLGGSVQVFVEEGSSMEKGESKRDTMRSLQPYCDLFVIRGNEAGMVHKFAEILNKPVINAGDGTREHPTQSILDIYTILKKLGRLDNLTGVVMGDLAHSRTIHSLLLGLRKYSGNKFYGYSPNGLELPEELIENDYVTVEYDDIPDTKPDFVYLSRLQDNLDPSIKGKYKFQFSQAVLNKLPEHCIIMHALPRRDELRPDIEKDKRVIPFEQVAYGIPTRMAEIALLLGCEDKILALKDAA